jgi:hypothetical protein
MLCYLHQTNDEPRTVQLCPISSHLHLPIVVDECCSKIRLRAWTRDLASESVVPIGSMYHRNNSVADQGQEMGSGMQLAWLCPWHIRHYEQVADANLTAGAATAFLGFPARDKRISAFSHQREGVRTGTRAPTLPPPAPLSPTHLSLLSPPQVVPLCHGGVVRSEGIRVAPLLLSATQLGDELSASLPGGTIPGTHWIGGWVDPRADLDAMEERKTLPLLRIEPGPSNH